MPRTKQLSIISAIVVVAAALGSLAFSYTAGCAGDLKGGTLGDPHRALELEGYGLGPFIVAVFGAGIGCFVVVRRGVAVRAVASVGALLLTFVLLLLAGAHMQGLGVRACLAGG